MRVSRSLAVRARRGSRQRGPCAFPLRSASSAFSPRTLLAVEAELLLVRRGRGSVDFPGEEAWACFLTVPLVFTRPRQLSCRHVRTARRDGNPIHLGAGRSKQAACGSLCPREAAAGQMASGNRAHVQELGVDDAYEQKACHIGSLLCPPGCLLGALSRSFLRQRKATWLPVRIRAPRAKRSSWPGSGVCRKARPNPSLMPRPALRCRPAWTASPLSKLLLKSSRRRIRLTWPILRS